jgi:hypothetical protein
MADRDGAGDEKPSIVATLIRTQNGASSAQTRRRRILSIRPLELAACPFTGVVMVSPLVRPRHTVLRPQGSDRCGPKVPVAQRRCDQGRSCRLVIPSMANQSSAGDTRPRRHERASLDANAHSRGNHPCPRGRHGRPVVLCVDQPGTRRELQRCLPCGPGAEPGNRVAGVRRSRHHHHVLSSLRGRRRLRALTGRGGRCGARPIPFDCRRNDVPTGRDVLNRDGPARGIMGVHLRGHER